ncbi:hypothetical protein K7432_017936 [Basidiobolus ranarum]|uniref:Uncharacterized protein n=1 Tax=Basidiobolus ranarum TaxID=34480 RepID=A0ABR2VJP8_9FUNG
MQSLVMMIETEVEAVTDAEIEAETGIDAVIAKEALIGTEVDTGIEVEIETDADIEIEALIGIGVGTETEVGIGIVTGVEIVAEAEIEKSHQKVNDNFTTYFPKSRYKSYILKSTSTLDTQFCFFYLIYLKLSLF